MPKNKKCKYEYRSFSDYYACTELALEDSDYCLFHKPNKTEDEAKSFQEKIKDKLRTKNHNFIGHYFTRDVDFTKQVFDIEADFAGSTFHGHAEFTKSFFTGGGLFDKSTFEKGVSFREATFERSTTFAESTFEISANFRGSTFKEDAYFYKSTLAGSVNFKKTTFEGAAYFREATFWGYVDFAGSTFESVIDFRNVTFKDNAFAKEVYRIAKTYSQRQGEYTLAGEYYYKERIAKRKQLPWYSHKRWFEYILLDGLCGYGERPLRAIRTGLGVLFGLALLYWKVGHIYPSPELFKEPDHALTFWDSLYFSVVTFTTLGFGDWRPDPSHWIRYVVMSEAFIGAFLMALFIVTFARRMMR